MSQKRKQNIPMEVLGPDGCFEISIPGVLGKWQNDFSDLLNVTGPRGCEQTDLTNACPPFTPGKAGQNPEELNTPIQMYELLRALRSAHDNKACGLDALPAEDRLSKMRRPGISYLNCLTVALKRVMSPLAGGMG